MFERVLGVLQMLNGIFVGLGTLGEPTIHLIAWAAIALLWLVSGYMMVVRSERALVVVALAGCVWLLLASGYHFSEGYSFATPSRSFKASYILGILALQAISVLAVYHRSSRS